MRQVTSPTARVVLGLLATLLTASMLTAAPASAMTPPAPGNFTGYGFDACSAPSQSTMDTWNLRSPFSAIGIYISGNSRYCGDAYQPNLSKTWVETNTSHGWRFIPIHVGYQSPCFKNNPDSRVQKKKMSTTVSTARSQATSDANEAIAALKKYGFAAGAVMYLDLEWYSRTTACDNVVLEFEDKWTEVLHAAGYKSGVYSSGSAAIKATDSAVAAGRSGFTVPDHLWIAWTNKVANTDGGPYVGDSRWADHQRIHQYYNGVNVTYGGKTINIDKDFLDVGKGSVAAKEVLPCDVRLSFTSYSTLKLGATGAHVSALQCLLKMRGLKDTITGEFGTGTRNGVNAFRKLKGWTANGTVDRKTWVALLSYGTKPRIMKYGSANQAVWVLQRALVASSRSVPINGLYKQSTVLAVQNYRSKNGLHNYTTTESSVWSLLMKGKTG